MPFALRNLLSQDNSSSFDHYQVYVLMVNLGSPTLLLQTLAITLLPSAATWVCVTGLPEFAIAEQIFLVLPVKTVRLNSQHLLLLLLLLSFFLSNTQQNLSCLVFIHLFC